MVINFMKHIRILEFHTFPNTLWINMHAFACIPQQKLGVVHLGLTNCENIGNRLNFLILVLSIQYIPLSISVHIINSNACHITLQSHHTFSCAP